MKAIRFLPLAYLADVHGFVLFAPYLVLVMAVALCLQQLARRRARLGRLSLERVIELAEPCEPCPLDAALAAAV